MPTFCKKFVVLALLITLLPFNAWAGVTKSATLNGTTQGFTAADSASLSVTGNMTLECWVKLSAEPGVGVEWDILDKHDNGDSANGRSWTWSYMNSGGTKQLFWRNSSDGTSGNQTTGSVNTTLGTATWKHLRAVYTAAAGTVDMYVDEVSVGQVTAQKTSIFDSATVVSIGMRGDSAHSATGIPQISLCRVWNTTHTTDDKCTVYATATSNMQAEWSLDNVLTDASGNTNTLTNVNTATFTTDIPSCLGGVTNSFWHFIMMLPF